LGFFGFGGGARFAAARISAAVLGIIKSEGEEGAAAATRPKISYFRAGTHDFFFSNL